MRLFQSISISILLCLLSPVSWAQIHIAAHFSEGAEKNEACANFIWMLGLQRSRVSDPHFSIWPIEVVRGSKYGLEIETHFRIQKERIYDPYRTALGIRGRVLGLSGLIYTVQLNDKTEYDSPSQLVSAYSPALVKQALHAAPALPSSATKARLRDNLIDLNLPEIRISDHFSGLLSGARLSEILVLAGMKGVERIEIGPKGKDYVSVFRNQDADRVDFPFVFRIEKTELLRREISQMTTDQTELMSGLVAAEFNRKTNEFSLSLRLDENRRYLFYSTVLKDGLSPSSEEGRQIIFYDFIQAIFAKSLPNVRMSIKRRPTNSDDSLLDGIEIEIGAE